MVFPMSGREGLSYYTYSPRGEYPTCSITLRLIALICQITLLCGYMDQRLPAHFRNKPKNASVRTQVSVRVRFARFPVSLCFHLAPSWEVMTMSIRLCRSYHFRRLSQSR